MLLLRQFSSSAIGLTDPATGVEYVWTELESIDVPITWRLSARGMRPFCHLIFGFSRGRRCRITPPRSLWSGRVRLVQVETVLREAILAAPAGAAIAPRAWLMAGIKRPGEPPPQMPPGVAALVAEAEADFARLRYSDAERTIARASQIEPHNTEVLRLDARLAVDREFSGHAIIARYQALLRQIPNDPEAAVTIAALHAVNDWIKSESETETLRLNAAQEPQVAFALAVYFRRNHRYAEAIAVLQELRSRSGQSWIQDAASAELDLIHREDRFHSGAARPVFWRRIRHWGSILSVGLGVLLLFWVQFELRFSAPKAQPAKSPTVVLTRPAAKPKPAEDDPTLRSFLPTPLQSASTPDDSPPRSAALLEKARSILQASTSEEAFRQVRALLEQAVETDNPEAMTRYALFCQYGLGGPPDLELAEKYYRAAAFRGDSAARFFLYEYLKQQSKSRQIAESQSDLAELLRSSAAGYFVPAMDERRAHFPPRIPAYPDESEAPASHPPIVYFQAHPIYPAAARYLDLSGEVQVKFVVDRQGKVSQLEVLSSTCALFDQAAIDAVRQWRFVPAAKDGENIENWMQVPLRFALNAPP